MFASDDIDWTFRAETIPDVIQWIQTEGDNIIFIYGGDDPWTGGAVELTGQTNALKVIQPGANHRVKILDLNEQDLVLSTLEEWLGIEIDVIVKRVPSISVPPYEAMLWVW